MTPEVKEMLAKSMMKEAYKHFTRAAPLIEAVTLLDFEYTYDRDTKKQQIGKITTMLLREKINEYLQDGVDTYLAANVYKGDSIAERYLAEKLAEEKQKSHGASKETSAP